MSKQPETIFKEQVQEDLKTLKNCWFVKVQQMVIRGIPDILACVNGVFVALELKKDSKARPDKLQEYNIGKIRRTGKGIALVIHPKNWHKEFEKLKRLDEKIILYRHE